MLRWRNGDLDIEAPSRTYEDWTTCWWQWAHSMPNNGNPQNHPLRSDGSKAHIGQPHRYSALYKPVWFCGGNWEFENLSTSRKFELPIEKTDCSFLFAVIVSGIAEDEFGPPFLSVNPTPKEKIEAAVSVIADPSTTANVTIQGPGFIERLQKEDLDLIVPNKLIKICPSKGFEVNGFKGPIDLGTAGYWYFLRGPLPSGTYNITLGGDSPKFGSHSRGRNNERYKSFLTYEIVVPQND